MLVPNGTHPGCPSENAIRLPNSISFSTCISGSAVTPSTAIVRSVGESTSRSNATTLAPLFSTVKLTMQSKLMSRFPIQMNRSMPSLYQLGPPKNIITIASRARLRPGCNNQPWAPSWPSRCCVWWFGCWCVNVFKEDTRTAACGGPYYRLARFDTFIRARQLDPQFEHADHGDMEIFCWT